MIRQLVLSAVVTATLLCGPSPNAVGQYAVRGGPIAAQRGPSYYYGAYAPSFYTGQLPGAYIGPGAGAGYLPNYGNAYPQFPNGGMVVVPPPQVVYYPQPAVVQPPPMRPIEPAPPGPSTPPGPPTTPPSSLSPARPPAPGTASSAAPVTSGVAHFTVTVPIDAKLWVNDVETRQTGDRRRFHTPENLETGRTYEYTFRAQWTEGSQTVTRDRTIRFKVGDDLSVDFTQAPGR